MSDIVATIESEIERLEIDLRSDPRFRKLTLLRGLHGEYSDEDVADRAPERAMPRLPAPTRQTRKSAGRKPKAVAPAKKPRKTRAPREAKGTEDFDAAVLAAISQLQQKGKPPTFAAIEKIAGGYAASIGKAIERLTKQGALTPQGGRQNRTYVMGAKSLKRSTPPQSESAPQESEDEDEAELQQEEEQPEKPKFDRPLIPLPDGYDIDQFRRAEREVLCALLCAGDGAVTKDIAKSADVEPAYLPMILVQLKRAQLVSDEGDGWEFTDLGYAVAKAVHAEERE